MTSDAVDTGTTFAAENQEVRGRRRARTYALFDDLFGDRIEHVKILTAGAAAGLLFSLGFVANAPTYDWIVRGLLIAGWIGLAAAALVGAAAQVSFLSLKRIFTPDRDWPPGWHRRFQILQLLRAVQQAVFVASGIAIGAALVHIMTVEPPLAMLPVRDAVKAVEVARRVVPEGETIRKLDRVDLVRGPDPNSGASMAWSVQFDVDVAETVPRDRMPLRRTRDVMVTADGKPSLVEPR